MVDLSAREAEIVAEFLRVQETVSPVAVSTDK
jgi:hypothetical protein